MGGAAIGVAVAAVARARAVAQRLAGQRGEDGRGGGVVQEEPAAVAAVLTVAAAVVDKEAEVLIKLSHDELTQFFCKCCRRKQVGKKD